MLLMGNTETAAAILSAAPVPPLAAPPAATAKQMLRRIDELRIKLRRARAREMRQRREFDLRRR